MVAQLSGCSQDPWEWQLYEFEMQAMDAASVSILLDERLEACVEPRDQDAVAGVLGDIFSDLPAVVMACHYDALLKENSFV